MHGREGTLFWRALVEGLVAVSLFSLSLSLSQEGLGNRTLAQRAYMRWRERQRRRCVGVWGGEASVCERERARVTERVRQSARELRSECV